MESNPQPNPSSSSSSAATGSSSDKFWKISTVVLIVLLAFFAFRGSFGGDKVTGAAVANPGAGTGGDLPLPSVAVDMKELLDDDPVLGDNDAPVTIVEFSDYQCPFCGRFYSQTLGQIKSKYIDTGKVRLVFRDFPLSFHPEAEPSALAANCAGEQGKYYEFHDKVFENQASLSSTSRKQWASEIGLDVAKWEKCQSDPDQLAEVRKDFQDGQAVGVQGTPAFFVNGKLISGAQPYSVFEQIIEAELNN